MLISMNVKNWLASDRLTILKRTSAGLCIFFYIIIYY